MDVPSVPDYVYADFAAFNEGREPLTPDRFAEMLRKDMRLLDIVVEVTRRWIDRKSAEVGSGGGE